ncbi:MAG: YihY/virulence factor BrkB family protein, partial [Phycisphaeraceae bacterium]|nr:YihY/virulence factor BrkB family protein [Phycisphaeraceae bacterium]
MGKRQRILEFFKRLWTSPVDELTRWQRTVKFCIDLSRHCARELRHDKAPQMAAALTYHTLLSLLPTIVLAMTIQFAFLEEAQRQQFKQAVVDFLLPKISEKTSTGPKKKPAEPAEKTKSPPPAPDHGDDAPPPAEAEAEADEQDNPAKASVPPGRTIDQGRQALAETIQRRMADLESIHRSGIGRGGLLIFIYGATSLLSTAERSFNAIFGVSAARPIYMRLPLYYTVITLGPVVLLTGQWAQKQFLAILEAGQSTGWLVRPMVVLSPLLTTWLVMAVTFISLPNTRVQLRAAAVGSFISAALVVGFVELFQYYVQAYISSFAVESIYGVLALAL